MFFHAGVKKTYLISEKITEKCVSCGKYGTVTITLFQEYFHIFWIPIFPTAKVCTTRCSHCKHTLEKKELPWNYHYHYDSLKTKTKVPWWTFVGLGCIINFIVFLIIHDRNRDSTIKEYLNDIQKGDVYTMKTYDSKYVLYKVDSIGNDSIYMKIGKTEFIGLSDVDEYKTMGNEPYKPFPEAILKSKLTEYFENSHIVEVNRPTRIDKLLSSIQKQDKLIIKTYDLQYKIYKVDSVVEDTVFMKENKNLLKITSEINKFRDVADSTYMSFSEPILMKTLYKYYRRDKLIDVIRK